MLLVKKKKKKKAVVTDGIEGNSCLFLFLFDTASYQLAVFEVLGKAKLYSCSGKINNIKMPYQRIFVEIDIQAVS